MSKQALIIGEGYIGYMHVLVPHAVHRRGRTEGWVGRGGGKRRGGRERADGPKIGCPVQNKNVRVPMKKREPLGVCLHACFSVSMSNTRSPKIAKSDDKEREDRLSRLR